MGAPKMRAIVAPHSIAQCFNFFRRNGVNLNIQEDDVLQKNEESVLYFVWHIVLYDIFRYLKVSILLTFAKYYIKHILKQWNASSYSIDSYIFLGKWQHNL